MRLPFDHYQTKIALSAMLCLFLAGCSEHQPLRSDDVSIKSGAIEPNTEDLSTKNNAATVGAAPYSASVAFAGGGWRAHTGHSAWVMALLSASDNGTLQDAFSNIDALSSNSGGSWFSTMLNYSNEFVSSIEDADAVNNWSKSGSSASGWLGQQQYLFDQASCHLFSGDAFLACVFRHYTGGVSNAAYWKNVVEEIVFRNNKITEPLNGNRQAWAKDKPLLLAATMLTNEVVVGEVGIEKQYYQACVAPSTPATYNDSGASCSASVTTRNVDVTPVTFSSVPQSGKFEAPPFFSALNVGTANTKLNMAYTENSYKHSKPFKADIVNPVANDQVPVMIAASASSAAAGFAASRAVTGSWEESYLGSDEALSFRLEGGLEYLRANDIKAQDLKGLKVIQIADGGAVDNSAVAQLVSFLQQNNKASGFNIIAFDNVQKLYQPTGNAPKVGIDIANLFGKGLSNGNQICSGANGSGTCVTVPDLAVFSASGLSATQLPTWSAKAPTNDPAKGIVNELIYTKYTVTTVDNPTFGVAAGATGTLHAFTAAWSNANTAPTDKTLDGDFKAYGDMLAFINQGLKIKGADGKTGVEHLKGAFGL